MNLSSQLWSLSKEALKKVNEYKKSSKVVIRSRIYVRSKVTDFKYNEGNISYGKSFDNISKNEWDIKDQINFIDESIKTLNSYKKACNNIKKIYKVNQNQADSWLGRFIQLLTYSIDKTISEKELIDSITNFICDLDQGPFEFQSKIWIDGVWLEDDRLKLSEELVIRKPQKEDLEDERPMDLLISGFPTFEPRETSSAILELSYRTDKQQDLSKEIDMTINCLRLFKVGSVHSIKSQFSSKSILNLSGSTFSTFSKSTHYKYLIKKDEIRKMRTLLKVLKPKLFNLRQDEESNPIGIALQRYEEALLGQGVIESRITSAITCLEALVLGDDERAELAGRLSQRVACLLSFTNKIPIEINRNLLLAYDIRSKFIHGSLVSKEVNQNNEALASKILDYARQTLRIFLSLLGEVEKNNLINKLDNSLLDKNAKKSLGNIIKKIVF